MQLSILFWFGFTASAAAAAAGAVHSVHFVLGCHFLSGVSSF